MELDSVRFAYQYVIYVCFYIQNWQVASKVQNARQIIWAQTWHIWAQLQSKLKTSAFCGCGAQMSLHSQNAHDFVWICNCKSTVLESRRHTYIRYEQTKCMEVSCLLAISSSNEAFTTLPSSPSTLTRNRRFQFHLCTSIPNLILKLENRAETT